VEKDDQQQRSSTALLFDATSTGATDAGAGISMATRSGVWCWPGSSVPGGRGRWR